MSAQASRAEHQAPCACTEGFVCQAHPEAGFPHGDCPVGMQCPTCAGTEALLRAVIEVPRDKDAKRLVEAILERAKYLGSDDWAGLCHKLITIQHDARRLAVLLDERDAAMEALVTALEGFWRGVKASTAAGQRAARGRPYDPEQEHCPHGNIPLYPAHGWWCDDCCTAIEAALARVKGAE